MCSDKKEAEIMGRMGKGKVVDRGTPKYPKIFVYVPRIVATDTAFPFQIGEDVTVTIQGNKLIIEKRKRMTNISP